MKNILGNAVLTKVMEEAKESIKEGESIAAPLKRSGEFPPIVTHMIAVGERSGQLEQMLENVAQAYDTGVDLKIAAAHDAARATDDPLHGWIGRLRGFFDFVSDYGDERVRQLNLRTGGGV